MSKTLFKLTSMTSSQASQIHFAERAVAGDAGVVDQNVDRVKVLCDSGACRLDVASHAKVERVGHGATTHSKYLANDGFGLFCAGRAGAECDVRPRGRERERAGAADAA